MKISSYAVLSNPQLGDKLIGTDVNNMDVTKNFTIESLFQLGSSSGLFVPYTGATTNVNLGANNITANSFVKVGGTASQFLKANGTVDSTQYTPITYKVLTIGNITYDGTTLYNTSVLENTIGSFTIDMLSTNQLRVTLDDYVLAGIDLNSLYISSQNTSSPSGGVFQADLEESDFASGEILFMCALLNGLSTTTVLERGNLEIRIYN